MSKRLLRLWAIQGSLLHHVRRISSCLALSTTIGLPTLARVAKTTISSTLTSIPLLISLSDLLLILGQLLWSPISHLTILGRALRLLSWESWRRAISYSLSDCLVTAIGLRRSDVSFLAWNSWLSRVCIFVRTCKEAILIGLWRAIQRSRSWRSLTSLIIKLWVSCLRIGVREAWNPLSIWTPSRTPFIFAKELHLTRWALRLILLWTYVKLILV